MKNEMKQSLLAIVAMLFPAVVVAVLLFIAFSSAGCQTVGTTIATVQGARHEAAKIETDANRKALCSSNFDIVREMFGKNDQDWAAILTICESGQNSVVRVP